VGELRVGEFEKTTFPVPVVPLTVVPCTEAIVVATVFTVLVTSPVNAGILAAGTVPDARLSASRFVSSDPSPAYPPVTVRLLTVRLG
jgi:hypothetical protein